MNYLRKMFILLLSIITISCSAQRTLSEVASHKGVNSIYIGKAMLKMAGNNVKAADLSGVMDTSQLIDKLTSIEIIQCEEKQTSKEVMPLIDKILNAYPFEIFTEVSDDSSNVTISGVFTKDGEYVTMLLIKCIDDGEFNIILLKGKIDLATLQAALNNN